MTQPTVTKHWRKPVGRQDPTSIHWDHSTTLQLTISMQGNCLYASRKGRPTRGLRVYPYPRVQVGRVVALRVRVYPVLPVKKSSQITQLLILFVVTVWWKFDKVVLLRRVINILGCVTHWMTHADTYFVVIILNVMESESASVSFYFNQSFYAVSPGDSSSKTRAPNCATIRSKSVHHLFIYTRSRLSLYP